MQLKKAGELLRAPSSGSALHPCVLYNRAAAPEGGWTAWRTGRTTRGYYYTHVGADHAVTVRERKG